MPRLRLLALLAAMLLLVSCLGLGGGVTGTPLFSLAFRDGSSFPHLEPANNVLLLDVAESTDYLQSPPQAALRIDGALVQVAEVEGGRNELPFPPAAWTPVAGEHELAVTIGDVERSLPFSWHE